MDAAPAHRLPTPDSSRRWLRRAAWALGGLLVLWLVSWLALPPLLKWQLQKQGTAALGRTVTVERVVFRPWSLELELQGLAVANAAGSAPQFSLQRLYMNSELQSLLRLAPVLDALRLESPRLNLRHLGDGRTDIDDILQRLRGQPDTSGEPSSPARFALFNIELLDGEATLVDEPVDTTHRLQGVELAVPFLSNLGSRRDVVTEPRLAFSLNGSAFDSRASTTPFASHRRTEVRLQIPELDVQPYLAYWPREWPVRPVTARLHVDLSIDFEQEASSPTLALSGTVGLSGVRWQQGDLPLLAWRRLDVNLRRLEPLNQRVELARVNLDGPEIHLRREADGVLGLQRIVARWAALVPPEPAGATAGRAEPAPWTAAVDEIAIGDGALRWRDESLAPAVERTLDGLTLNARAITWPMTAPAPFEGSARLGDASLSLSGAATDRQADARVVLGGLQLAQAAPYLATQLTPALDGQLEAEAVLAWRAPQGAEAAALTVGVSRLALAGLRLGPARSPLARLERLTVGDAQLDLTARQVTVASVELDAPDLSVRRSSDGRWMFEDWLRTRPAASPPPATPEAATPWGLTLADVRLQGGRVRFLDELPPGGVALLVSGLGLRVQNLQPLAAQPPEAALQLQARVSDQDRNREQASTEPGRVALQGTLRLPGREAGLRLRTGLRIERLPLHALAPYVADRLNLELLRADASVRGDLALALTDAGPAVELAADAALEDVRAHTLAPGEELLSWTSLQLRGLRVGLAPGRATTVQVGETVLSDYFARIVIDEQGRINLQGLVKPAPDNGGTTPAAPDATASAAPAPDIRVGPVSLVNGRVLFSDRFIRPNYTANLSDLTGSLSSFSSAAPEAGQPPALADLSLKGRAEGTAQLDISGKINPLATPLSLDIKGQVRDLELPPLSPYSAKYAGYGIERGKLSVDVRYRIDPGGQLEASNQIVLNQLAFGERVEGSSANLPVKLAVALLADRNGVIDINLPVSGSINDPQFRLAPIIVRLIVNLIGKAITAPFSLMASAFGGGGADASQIAFEPGRAELDAQDRQQLEAVAKALDNRPALQLTIVGQADLDAERAGWQRARLDGLLLAEKRRRLARAGAAMPAEVTVRPEERIELLREVYRRADIPKPRNLIGIARDIPPPEMEALLLAAQVPGEQAMRDLAVARAVAVKDHLLAQKLGEDRVFLGAPKATAGGQGARPQAELQLAPR